MENLRNIVWYVTASSQRHRSGETMSCCQSRSLKKKTPIWLSSAPNCTVFVFRDSEIDGHTRSVAVLEL
jgi:hypothetical protein